MPPLSHFPPVPGNVSNITWALTAVTATVLHILARNYRKDYKDVPEHIRRTVIKYLLEHRTRSSSETRAKEEALENPS